MAEDSSIFTTLQFYDCRWKLESFSWHLSLKDQEKTLMR